MLVKDAPDNKAVPYELTRGAQDTDSALDSPPAYEQPSYAAAVPAGVKTANFISIVRRMGEIKETLVLDPTLQLPQEMQPKDKDAKHLNLSATMGEAVAEVFIVGSGTPKSGKTRIQVSSTLGETRLVLHAPHVRAPISLSVSTSMGEAKVLLPRSYRGPLRVSTILGEVKLSEALRAATTMYGNGRWFVGEWTQGEVDAESWPGDEAEVATRMGEVYLGYDDDEKRESILQARSA